MNPDFINALFELGASFVLWLNIQQLLKDRKISGVRISPTAFFAVWGFWNLYYYLAIQQSFSFYAGIVVVIMNTTWVVLALKYSKENK